MSTRARLWIRRLMAFVLALIMAAGGFSIQDIAYALEDNADGDSVQVESDEDVVQVESTDVTEEVEGEDSPATEESADSLDKEEEIALVQEANPEAVAYVTSNGSLTSYNDINAALEAWTTTVSGDVELTLLKNVKITLKKDTNTCADESISFASSGEKTLDLNGCTATITMVEGNETNGYTADNYVGKVAISVGQDTENMQGPTVFASVTLCIDDSATGGALVCNNAETVIKVSGYYSSSVGQNFSSRLELRGGTIRGGTQNTIWVFGNEKVASTTYNAQFKMAGGTISGCAGTADTDEAGYGVRLYGKALFEMKGGAICQNSKSGVYLKCYFPSGVSGHHARPLFSMYGGTISDNDGEGVNVDRESGFTMYGGSISSNGANGVLMGMDSNFTMYGGTISDNSTDGVLMAKDSDLTMYGGTISGNERAGVSVDNLDHYQGEHATFTMSGGKITGNAEGVLVSESEHNVFNLKGSPTIMGNGSQSQACNVKLEGAWEMNGSTVTKTGQLIHITGPLTTPADGPQIGVTKPVDGTDVYFTADYATHHQSTDPATFFKSDALTVKASGGDKTGNAYICWNQGENNEGTGPLDTDNCEAARVAHTHIWEPVYQYTLSLNNGTLEYDHKENVLTAQCFNALANKKAIKHGACPNVASATLTLSAQSKEYDGTPVVATLTESEGWKADKPFGYDASKIEYFKEDGTALSGAPKDVGDYVAKFRLDGNESAAPGNNTKYNNISTSFSITPHVDPPTPPATNNDVAYSAHCQTYAWSAPSGSNGTTAGTTGEAKRLEALSIKLDDKTAGSIEYRSHLQGIGWESSWAKDGGQSGTTGEAKRLEAIQIRLTGDRAKNNSVWYRVHSQTFGWLGWAKNGEPAGTTGMSKRAEAYQVVVLPDGQLPQSYDASVPAFRSAVTGKAHVQGKGWTGQKYVGTIGTTGKSKRLEGVRFTLPAGLTDVYGGGIAYEAHVQSKGWLGEVADGALAGTTGKSKRMEAVKIRFTGNISQHFSVWYRVHSQTFGWSGWAKDGNPAGTTGYSKRAEAVQVVILPIGAAAPGSTANAIRTKG